ncbi:MAG: hypothetical protein JO097_08895 [Acidobacteriaceae bacterium]|nr:hypothetical protein [Acidobacteriaceae bacterium]MBV9296409.1 hypothetical protein [Acidobacteriaceae bacterium]MBV9764379.1 hypothetical protein [Acidobacteriaceae bacterium]
MSAIRLIERLRGVAKGRLSVQNSIESYLLNILNTVEGAVLANPAYGRADFTDFPFSSELARTLERRIPALDRRVEKVRVRVLEAEMRLPGELAFLVEWWPANSAETNRFIAKRTDDGQFHIPDVLNRASI